MTMQQDKSRILSSAFRTLDIEAEGLTNLHEAFRGHLGKAFKDAVSLILEAKGKVVITGMGKSGLIGQKMAATLASTGTPSFFVHPAEASHGDLGMITKDDVIIACSWSGETVELASILNFTRRFNVPLIAITSGEESALGKAADHILLMPKVKEACPHGLAPTSSTTIQLALSDAVAVALLEAKGFTAEEFAVFHPGGKLGATLQYVEDLMHKEDGVPLAQQDMKMTDALVIMTEKSLGCLGVTDAEGKMVGVITDGDLRRKMGDGLLDHTVAEVMTPNPKTVSPETLASKALEIINSSAITALFVVRNDTPVGLIHIHDLLRSGVA